MTDLERAREAVESFIPGKTVILDDNLTHMEKEAIDTLIAEAKAEALAMGEFMPWLEHERRVNEAKAEQREADRSCGETLDYDAAYSRKQMCDQSVFITRQHKEGWDDAIEFFAAAIRKGSKR